MEDINWIQLPEQELSIKSNAKTVIKSLRNARSNGSKSKSSLLSVCQLTPPYPPDEKLTKKQLMPSTPSIYVTKSFTSSMRDFCLNNPIVLVHGVAEVFNINLGLFSSQTIANANPNDCIEVRLQMQQNSEENWNRSYDKKIWNCYSHRTHSTIIEYATYQRKEYRKSMKKKTMNNNETISDQANLNSKKIDQKMIECNKDELRFGTNVDLSCPIKWKPQLKELKKLPTLFQVESSENMLSYVGHDILGMNTVQLYMKVPGSRTPGHQENNNFCSVNINIGPGDCEWFAVPYEYWGALCSLCEHNGVDYLHGSWWPPNLDELYKKNIPVYRFYQKPGHLVWVNVGCVHWVQSIGYCNNIAWNVGPFTAKQYKAAIERYEWNKLQSFQSIVPMIHLSWNLARKISKVTDVKLHQMIRNCLLLTLRQYYLTKKFLKNKEVVLSECDVSYTPYCEKCSIEIFGVLLIYSKGKLNLPFCLDCALKCSSSLEGFVYAKSEKIYHLMSIYDKFILNDNSTPHCSKLEKH